MKLGKLKRKLAVLVGGVVSFGAAVVPSVLAETSMTDTITEWLPTIIFFDGGIILTVGDINEQNL